ncbi:protein phosphatase CheZ [Rhizosaccharibacter radicis]|uniref:Protein phosphatase CheZ n=1 Tax=Rhizosaccharibacter radicis TaxID=2782605 RepID=A0ABT1VX10_9PROT|nr:protein phosphatase CheZ [Acetobacteraceae bacterium KSS12]
MGEQALNVRALADRLAEICASYPTARPQMVADVVRAVIDTIGGELSAHETELLREVEDLGRTIAHAKEEIAALRSSTPAEGVVSTASEELDAVVAHTADATNAILEACERLDAVASGPGAPDAAVVQDATMRIYEACSFQDITGQRITKVVATLKLVETKVNRIIETFGPMRWDEVITGMVPESQRKDAHLLNGPQLPTAAMAQSDIDALLADF